MKKLRLDPEALRVESFATVVKKASGRGTVRANDGEEVVSTYCWTDPTADPTWQPEYTCPECAQLESHASTC